MHESWRTWAWVLLLLTSLGGCATSPAVRFFGLTPVEAPSAQADAGVIVGIGPLSVADYLNRPQIVSRSRAPELKVDEFNRWAEPLDEAIPRVVTLNVSRLTKQSAVIQLPTVSSLRPAYRVVGSVARFDVDAAGLAVLEVQWGVDDLDQLVSGPHSARYARQAARPGEPDSEVAALNELLAEFSGDIARRLLPLLESPAKPLD